MIISPLLMMLAPGVRVVVSGEGKLRFSEGASIALADAATLSPNAAGLLADAAGRPVCPAIRVSAGALTVSSNGTVTVAGKTVGKLRLERAGGEVGFPGQAPFGILRLNTTARPASTLASPSTGATKAPVGGPATVSIHAVNEILGERVLLRDVADLDGDAAMVARLGAVDLGAVPSVGVRRSLSSWTVKAALRSQGFREGSVTINYPPDATVARKGQTVDTETLVAEATAKAKEAAKGGAVVLTAIPSSFPAPLGELRFESTATRTGNSISVQVTAKVGDKWSRPTAMRFAVKGGGVKANDSVHITVSRNGAVVEIDGKAKTSGDVGETIQVLTAGGAIVTATVTGAGTAEVNL